MKHKVIKLRCLRDENNQRYIPYCDFRYHQGMIKPEQEPICRERKCNYYIKLRLDKR